MTDVSESLFVNVEFLMVTLPPALYTAAPYWEAVLPSKRESFTVSVPYWLRIAPPLLSAVTSAVLFLNIEFEMSNVPLYIVAPSFETEYKATADAVFESNKESFIVPVELAERYTPVLLPVKVESETSTLPLNVYIAPPDQPAELLLKSLFVTVSEEPLVPDIAPPSRPA